jgi:hypothetical protein
MSTNHPTPHKKEKTFFEYLLDLENLLEDLLVKKAPPLPVGGKDFLTKIAPYFVAIGLVFTVFGLLGVLSVLFASFGFLGYLSAYMPMHMSYYYGGFGFGLGMWLQLAMMAFSIFLQVRCLQCGVFNHTKRSWKFMFYGALVGVLSSLFSGALSLILSFVGLYFLFQIKESFNR